MSTPLSVTASVERRDARVAGEGLLTIGATGWALVVSRAGCEPWRRDGAWDEVQELEREGTRGITLSLARGDRVRLAFGTEAEATATARELTARCCTLPELTRAMRALGARRTAAAGADRDADRFFAPLLEARRRASMAPAGTDDAAEALEAFRGARLAAALEKTAAEYAAEAHAQHPSARRALEARLGDELEPLLAALVALDEAAEALHRRAGEPPRVGAWRAWVARLRIVFERADEAWPRLAAELARVPRAAAPVPRKRGRR